MYRRTPFAPRPGANQMDGLWDDVTSWFSAKVDQYKNLTVGMYEAKVAEWQKSYNDFRERLSKMAGMKTAVDKYGSDADKKAFADTYASGVKLQANAASVLDKIKAAKEWLFANPTVAQDSGALMGNPEEEGLGALPLVGAAAVAAIATGLILISNWMQSSYTVYKRAEYLQDLQSKGVDPATAKTMAQDLYGSGTGGFFSDGSAFLKDAKSFLLYGGIAFVAYQFLSERRR